MLGKIAIAFFASFICTRIIWFVMNGIVLMAMSKKILNKAIEQGHVVEAHRVSDIRYKYTSSNARNDQLNETDAVYEYEVDGKKYKITLAGYGILNDTVTLYYRNRPSKATVARDIGSMETSPVVIFIVLMILFLAIQMI